MTTEQKESGESQGIFLPLSITCISSNGGHESPLMIDNTAVYGFFKSDTSFIVTLGNDKLTSIKNKGLEHALGNNGCNIGTVMFEGIIDGDLIAFAL